MEAFRPNRVDALAFLLGAPEYPPAVPGIYQRRIRELTMPIQDTVEGRRPASGASAPPPEHKKGSAVRIVVYFALLALVGFVVWRIYQNQLAAKKQSASQAAALQSRPVPVQVTAAEQKPMPIFLTALGTVTPYMSVTVKSRVGGELLPVKFTEGQEVRKGEVIMVIDPKPYQAALNQAKGNLAHDQALLNNAKAEYARYKSLYDAGVVSKETLDANQASLGQYEGAIAADQAGVDNAQLQLSWCYIQSPIDGRIGLRLVDPGNVITANTTNLVVINQFKPIAVYFTLPESQLPEVLKKLRVNKNMPADAYDRADMQKLATGQLLTADNQIDTTTGTARLKAVFENRDEALFPNQFVNIHLVLENRPNALVVPSAAIQSGVQGTFVWTTENDSNGHAVAKIQPVKIALAEGQSTILESGPPAGTNVVVDGADRLRPGQPVTVSAAHQRGGHADQSGGENPQAGGLFSAPPSASGSQGNGKQNAKEHQ
jgi:multidrug efflux system membrane fusion protein